MALLCSSGAKSILFTWHSMSLIMLTTVLRATVLISSKLSSLSGIIFHPLRLPRHFLTRKAISCCWLTGSSLSGLGFLKFNVSMSPIMCNTRLDTAGELVLDTFGELFLDRDCFSLAALKLAWRLSSLLKLLALWRAGLIALVTNRGEPGGSGDLEPGHSDTESSSGCSGMFLECHDGRMKIGNNNYNGFTLVLWMDFCLERPGYC